MIVDVIKPNFDRKVLKRDDRDLRTLPANIIQFHMVVDVVLDESLSPPAPRIRIDGEALSGLMKGMRRCPAEVRKLMRATENLQAFSDLKREMGWDAWLPIHAAICAELQPRLYASGAVLFHGLPALKEPLLLVAGDAMLLATSPEWANTPNAPPAEVVVLQPGDCLTRSALTWVEPRSMTAVARSETLQLFVLPPGAFPEAARLAQLRLLHRRTSYLRKLPLLGACSEEALRALAHAGRASVHAVGSRVIQQGDDCWGVTALLRGSASVCYSQEGGADERMQSFMGAVHAPELLGVIDLMSAVVRWGDDNPPREYENEAQRRAAPTFECHATHDVSVVAGSTCHSLLIGIADLLRHCGEQTLVEMANASRDRGLVRAALVEEIARQHKAQKVKRKLQTYSSQVRLAAVTQSVASQVSAEHVPRLLDRRFVMRAGMEEKGVMSAHRGACCKAAGQGRIADCVADLGEDGAVRDRCPSVSSPARLRSPARARGGKRGSKSLPFSLKSLPSCLPTKGSCPPTKGSCLPTVPQPAPPAPPYVRPEVLWASSSSPNLIPNPSPSPNQPAAVRHSASESWGEASSGAPWQGAPWQGASWQGAPWQGASQESSSGAAELRERRRLGGCESRERDQLVGRFSGRSVDEARESGLGMEGVGAAGEGEVGEGGVESVESEGTASRSSFWDDTWMSTDPVVVMDEADHPTNRAAVMRLATDRFIRSHLLGPVRGRALERVRKQTRHQNYSKELPEDLHNAPLPGSLSLGHLATCKLPSRELTDSAARSSAEAAEVESAQQERAPRVLAAPGGAQFAACWSSAPWVQVPTEEAAASAVLPLLLPPVVASHVVTERDGLVQKQALEEMDELQRSLDQLIRDGTPSVKTARFDEGNLVL